MKVKEKTIQELEKISEEIREKLINIVSKRGGHLASNLGVVELTMALHYVFNSPKDKILWDVGHQSYVHKILTDREDRMDTIRTKGGLNPFTDPKESPHDHFIAGHAGNSLSAGYGIAVSNPDDKVIVILGDASLGNGQSLEALNNISGNAKNMIIILNDNGMSIGQNVGGLSKYFTRLMSSKFYNKIKRDFENKVKSTGKIGKNISKIAGRFEASMKYFFSGSAMTVLGFKFIGPVDGNDLSGLISMFKEIKEMEGPIFIHMKTIKGKGYEHAEKNMEKFHGISPFNIKTGETANSSESYSCIFGKKICELAENDDKIMAISAAMIKGTGLSNFFQKYKNRAFDMGMTEEHCVTFAGGLAINGNKPYVAIYSTFLQRAYDQILNDIAIQKLPVRFIIDRAGIVGEDGKTHNGTFDISYMLSVPDMIVLAPTCIEEFESIMDFSANYNEGPLSIRIPRGKCYKLGREINFELGKWTVIEEGKERLIIASGSMLEQIMNIKDDLKDRGINPTIVAASSINPLDKEFLMQNYLKYDKIFIMEENIEKSGFASHILDFFNEKLIRKNIIKLAIPHKFIDHARRDEILEEIGLKGINLLNRIIEGR